MNKDLWAKAQIEPDLREHILLSVKDVHQMTVAAMQAADPTAKLSELLNAHGRARKEAIERNNEARRAKDKAFFLDRQRWPGRVCRVKTQPWIKERRFGTVHGGDFACGRWIVRPENEAPALYASIDDLVREWSVD